MRRKIKRERTIRNTMAPATAPPMMAPFEEWEEGELGPPVGDVPDDAEDGELELRHDESLLDPTGIKLEEFEG
jgi:hypothetical protein